jgi:integrator complex subunit 11
MPGYCVSGTVGAKVLSGAKRVEIEKGQMIDVKLSVQVRFYLFKKKYKFYGF